MQFIAYGSHCILKKLHMSRGIFVALAQALLAVLVSHPSSGYDLTKYFDSSVGFFWKASHQQIYRELARLEELGWLTAEAVAQAGRPDKKVFTVTQEGQAHLRQWLKEPAEPIPMRDDLLVKITAGHLVEPRVLQTELERQRVLHRERLAVYQELQKQYFPEPNALSAAGRCSYITLRCGMRYEMGWLDWCEEAITLLQNPS